MSVLDGAALLLSAFGVLAGFSVFASTRRLGLSLGVALELWTAAGLLRLSADVPWTTITAAGAILLVRKVVVWSVHPAHA